MNICQEYLSLVPRLLSLCLSSELCKCNVCVCTCVRVGCELCDEGERPRDRDRNPKGKLYQIYMKYVQVLFL